MLHNVTTDKKNTQLCWLEFNPIELCSHLLLYFLHALRMWRQPWQWMLMKATCWRRWFVQIVHPTWMIRWELWHFLKGIKISENTFMILYVYNLRSNIGIVKWNSFNISFVWSYYSSWMPSAGCAFGWLHDHRSQDSLGCTSWFGNHVTIGGFQLHHRCRFLFGETFSWPMQCYPVGYRVGSGKGTLFFWLGDSLIHPSQANIRSLAFLYT